MNDLVEGCKYRLEQYFSWTVEDIYGKNGCEPSAEKGRHGVPEAQIRSQ